MRFPSWGPYEVPLSRMLHDILDDDHIQWHPPLIGHYTNFWPLLILTLLPNSTCYLIVQSFHRTYATGATCQQRTLTPPDTWSCPTLGLACVLTSRPISPELVLSPDFWISNTPRYFSFACNGWGNPTKDACTSEHLIFSHVGLAFILMLRQVAPELVMFPEFEFQTSLSTRILLSDIPVLWQLTPLRMSSKVSGSMEIYNTNKHAYNSCVFWLYTRIWWLVEAVQRLIVY